MASDEAKDEMPDWWYLELHGKGNVTVGALPVNNCRSESEAQEILDHLASLITEGRVTDA